jgi:hypothetical protein
MRPITFFYSEKNKRIFTTNEDLKLTELAKVYPQGWSVIAQFMPGRTARQCRERYRSYLNPSVNHSAWSEEEDQLLIKLVREQGRKWSDFAKYFNGRSCNALKNRYNVHLVRNPTLEDDQNSTGLDVDTTAIQDQNPFDIFFDTELSESML